MGDLLQASTCWLRLLLPCFMITILCPATASLAMGDLLQVQCVPALAVLGAALACPFAFRSCESADVLLLLHSCCMPLLAAVLAGPALGGAGPAIQALWAMTLQSLILIPHPLVSNHSQGRRWEELAPHFEALWAMTLRVIDDIKESVRVAGVTLAR